jgi:hypothetical protein
VRINDLEGSWIRNGEVVGRNADKGPWSCGPEVSFTLKRVTETQLSTPTIFLVHLVYDF